MLLNGVGNQPQPAETRLPHEDKAKDIERQKQEARKEAVKAEEKKPADDQFSLREKEALEEASQMSEYDLKELLFLMSSRGNTQAVEKLAEVLKRERDLLSR